MEFIAGLVYPFFEREISYWEQGKIVGDYKSELQQIIQQSGVDSLTYVVIGTTGPDHAKTFTVEVHLNSNVIGTGTGRSKKLAEQQAAKEALELMGIK